MAPELAHPAPSLPRSCYTGYAGQWITWEVAPPGGVGAEGGPELKLVDEALNIRWACLRVQDRGAASQGQGAVKSAAPRCAARLQALLCSLAP